MTPQTQIKRIHTPNIYALSEIRTHKSSVRTSENSSCLRPHGYFDQQDIYIFFSRILVTWLIVNGVWIRWIDLLDRSAVATTNNYNISKDCWNNIKWSFQHFSFGMVLEWIRRFKSVRSQEQFGKAVIP
jgi:hypothetical protein